MNFKLPLIAAFVAAMSLSACGGGGGGSDNGAAATSINNPASLVINDITVGTGATVANGTAVTITYMTYLYDANAAANGYKGKLIDPGTFPLEFNVGAANLISGVSVGIVGMKVGGRRVLLIPAAQAYGATGRDPVPPNTGLVFEMTLLSAK